MTEGRATDAAGAADGGRPVLLGMDLAELTALVTGAGWPAFRAKQLHHWLYNRAAESFDEMHNLARDFRAWLNGNCRIGHITIAEVRESTDGSRKLLYRLDDGRIVEGVLMPERSWITMCISSQVGCAVDCKFCMTGFGGFQRQMTTAEIVSQVLLAKRLMQPDGLPRNLVFMGMGEPMLNLDAVIPAVRTLSDPDGVAMAARRITVSTSGVLPGIVRFGNAGVGANLAISLNASNDAFRSRIMPINRRYPIASLLDACREFPLKARQRITMEYVLLAGENDSPEDARELAALLNGMQCKVNLIPWNPDPRLPYRRPDEETVRRFQQVLLDRFFTVSVRYSKGSDIGAACGQLAGHLQSYESPAKAATA